MFIRSTLTALPLVTLCASLGCASTPAEEDAAGAESNWTAVPGAHQATLRATTGEQIVLAFDPVTKTDPRRPECTLTVAAPLRVRLYDRTSTAPEATATIDSFVRGRTVAFTRDDAASPGALRLRRVSPVAFGADVPDFVLAKRCSGEPLEYAQRWQFSEGGQALIDPIGNKPTFWTDLAIAPESGVSAISEHAVDLEATDGTKIHFLFRKLRGDDPTSPTTCERVEALPLRVTVETASAASVVTIDLENTWRSRTSAPALAYKTPPGTTLTKESPMTHGADLDPMTIAASCSGEPREYWQTVAISVDGRPLVDPIGQKPYFNMDLAKAPAR